MIPLMKLGFDAVSGFVVGTLTTSVLVSTPFLTSIDPSKGGLIAMVSNTILGIYYIR